VTVAKLFSVSVAPPGQPQLAIVIPDIECDESQALASAGTWALESIHALSKVMPAQWVRQIVSQTEVEDIKEKT
jgi:hypothetical protein